MSDFQIPAWMKKATPFIYARISGREQVADEAGKPLDKQTPLVAQVKGINANLRDQNLPSAKAKNTFYDLASGGGEPNKREGFKQLLEAILKHRGRAFVALSEPSRWSRNSVLGSEAYAPLYRRDIPLFDASQGLVAGTATDPRTNAQFMFLIKQGVGDVERGTLIDRVNRKKEDLFGQGILPASIGTAYPFARQDPLDVLNENIMLADMPKKDGGGATALGNLVVASTAPNGPTSAQWWKKEAEREAERVAKLSKEEYAEWYQFRKKFREISKKRDYDTGKYANPISLERNDVDWGMKALARFANGFLRYPFDPKYRILEDSEITEYLKNPKEYLSDNDKRLYRRLVSKR